MRNNYPIVNMCFSWSRIASRIGVVCVCVIPFLSAFGQLSYFLNVDGIPGDSTYANHRGMIDISSWSWSGEGMAIDPNSGRPSGNLQCKPVTFTMNACSASPRLMKTCAKNATINAVLYVHKGGPTVAGDFMSITFSGAVITSYQTGGAAGASALTDQFTIYFGNIQYSYSPQAANGSLGTPIKFIWNAIGKAASVEPTVPIGTPKTAAPGTAAATPLSNALAPLLGAEMPSQNAVNYREETIGDQKYLVVEVTRSKNPSDPRSIAQTSANLREWFGANIQEEVVEDSATDQRVRVRLPMDKVQQFLRWQVETPVTN